MNYKTIFFYFFFTFPFIVNSQEYFTFSGKINNLDGIAIPEINLSILELEKIRPLPDGYPRKEGMTKAKPLLS